MTITGLMIVPGLTGAMNTRPGGPMIITGLMGVINTRIIVAAGTTRIAAERRAGADSISR